MQLKEVCDWKVNRENALKKLKELADELDKHHRNTNIAKIAGTILFLI